LARGRKSRFKIPQEDIRQWFLDHIIDNEGNKIPFRKLWWSDEFIEYSGMTGERDGKKSSNGTMSYWLGKWGLSDKFIFEYHKEVTFKIPFYKQLDKWSKKHNKNTREEDTSFSILKYEEKKTRKVISRILKEYNHPLTVNKYTKTKVIWNTLEEDRYFHANKSKLYKLFNKYYKELGD